MDESFSDKDFNEKDIEVSETKSWADAVADLIEQRHAEPFVVEGMWTPSGFFHIGNARPEIFTPYGVRRVLETRGKKVVQNFIIDDFDAVRKIPGGLGIKAEDEKKFLGFPCATAPSPVPGFKSWADFFVSDVRKHITEFGVQLNIFSAYQMYKDGKFNDLIKFAIENSKEIVKVWNKVAGSDKEEDFVPIQMVCGKCKKIYYTKVLKFEGEQVEYECGECKFKGKASPFNGNSKLHWRVHWVAFWKVNSVDFESGGKDHFSKGGSVDVGQALAKEVFKFNPPLQYLTEFLQIGGAKMSGSVGNVINLGTWLKVASPELMRFMNFSYKPRTAIDFSLQDNSFVLLNDRYERSARVYFNLESAENDKMTQKLKHIYKLTEFKEVPERLIQVSFNTAFQWVQVFSPETDFENLLRVLKKVASLPENLSGEELKKLKNFLIRVKTWVDLFAPESFKVNKFLESLSPENMKSVSPEIKIGFKIVSELLSSLSEPDEIQQMVFDTAKELNVNQKNLFKALYNVLIGQDKGPKIGTLIFALGKEKVIKRLNEAVSLNAKPEEKKEFKDLKLNESNFSFFVDKRILELNPSFRVGIALVSNLNNSIKSSEVSSMLAEQERNLREKFSGFKASEIPNIALWRDAYAKFGGKPSKNSPSVEALASRVLKGEQLPRINSLVDLYNSFSLKYLIPLGGDDLVNVNGTVSLTFASGKEDFFQINSEKNEPPKGGEIIYRDDLGALCRRWNWRECNRTKITNETKSAVIYFESLNEKDNLKEILNEFKEKAESLLKAKVEFFIL